MVQASYIYKEMTCLNLVGMVVYEFSQSDGSEQFFLCVCLSAHNLMLTNVQQSFTFYYLNQNEAVIDVITQEIC